MREADVERHQDAQQVDCHPYVYVLIRRDIPLAQQLVQVGHAAFEAGMRFYSADQPGSSLIVLSVPDKRALLRASRRLAAKGVRTHTFFEPDFGMGESALATEPLCGESRTPLHGYPLWREPAAITGGETC